MIDPKDLVKWFPTRFMEWGREQRGHGPLSLRVRVFVNDMNGVRLVLIVSCVGMFRNIRHEQCGEEPLVPKHVVLCWR